MGGPGSGKSRRPIRRTRPQTTLFCRFRPRRTTVRKFNEKDAARVYCAAVANGASRTAIRARIEQRCPDDEERPRSADENVDIAIEAALEQTLVNMEAADQWIADAYKLFLVVNGILIALAFLLNAVPNPLVRLAARGSVVARVQVQGLLTRAVNVQKAANDSRFIVQDAIRVIRLLRRAA